MGKILIPPYNTRIRLRKLDEGTMRDLLKTRGDLKGVPVYWCELDGQTVYWPKPMWDTPLVVVEE